MAKLLPDTAEGLIEHMEKLFPEPRPAPQDTDADIKWRLAQRQVVLQIKDQYAAAKRRSV
jgi:hypothetical protein